MILEAGKKYITPANMKQRFIIVDFVENGQVYYRAFRRRKSKSNILSISRMDKSKAERVADVYCMLEMKEEGHG